MVSEIPYFLVTAVGYRGCLPLMTAVAPFVYIGARGGRDERETGRYEL